MCPTLQFLWLGLVAVYLSSHAVEADAKEDKSLYLGLGVGLGLGLLLVIAFAAAMVYVTWRYHRYVVLPEF